MSLSIDLSGSIVFTYTRRYITVIRVMEDCYPITIKIIIAKGRRLYLWTHI